ncbi:hypothetical protein GQ457_15G007880 [Hibiscus cannabinus]
MSLTSESLGVDFPTLSETHGGRPPEMVALPTEYTTLERQDSPISTELQPVSKKGRGASQTMDDSDMHMDVPEGGGQIGERLNVDHRSEQEHAYMKTSFRDTLVGTAFDGSIKKGISELDVTMNDDDVIYGGVVCCQSELQLTDLDNDYFLVRFAEEANFVKVLSGGPWVIYGSYLTVQPWSRNFSTTVTHPDKVMVWVWLPRLPYRYYTKSLFRYIVNAIGRVVRIDYNTEDGKRGRFARLSVIVDLSRPLVSGIVIDGTRQDIEYEGLTSICYSCGKYGHSKESCGKDNGNGDEGDNLEKTRDPKDLYRSWMQVVNRRWKALGTRSNEHGKDSEQRRDAIIDQALEFGTVHDPVVRQRKNKPPVKTSSLLLHDVREFLSRDWRVRIRYINRSGNMVANKLARMSRGKPIGEALFESPPLEVIPLLEKDISTSRS